MKFFRPSSLVQASEASGRPSSRGTRNYASCVLRPVLTVILCMALLLTGCDAFVRKFTRPKKKKQLSSEEMVLVPQEYKDMDKEEVYRRYFVFWQSWMDELTNALDLYPNYKKQVDCTERALKNLLYLRTLLNEEGQKKFDVYIDRMLTLKQQVAADLYGDYRTDNLTDTERLKMEISRDLCYSAIKDYIRK